MASTVYETEISSGEKEKPLVTLDLNLTFMQTPGSGCDPRARIGWVFFLQTRKLIRLVHFIGNTEGTVEIFVTALLVCTFLLITLPEKNLFAKYCSSQFINVQGSPVSVLHWFCFWQCLWSNLSSVLEERFQNHRCVRHCANPTWKVNYNSVDLWCWQIPAPVRLFIPSPCHNFGCVSSEVAGGLSYLQIAKTCHFQWPV